MSYQEDVKFVGAFVRGGDWEVGLRIARNVDPGTERARNRVSLSKFAEEAGLSDYPVRMYYKAWQKAADAGVVDPAETLASDDTYDFEDAGLGKPEWDAYYSNARYGNGSGPKRQPSKKEISDAIKADPALVTEAIKTDPEIEKAARGATIAKEIERSTTAKAKGRKIVDPIAPRDDTISQREIDEADAQFDSLIVKLRAMRKTGQEALSLALNIRGFDQNAKRALVSESVDGLRTLLDAIAEAADGRSMDDELQSLLSEGN